MSTVAHVAATLAAVFLLAYAGRVVAGRLRQPAVIGEIVVGLLVGPIAVELAGPDVFHGILLPDQVLAVLRMVAEAGLILYIAGLAHTLRSGQAPADRRTTSFVAVYGFAVAALAGVLLMGWVIGNGEPSLRGTAPWPALTVFGAAALSVTAVPVLARILDDRGLAGSATGRLALTAAIIIDTASWLLLSIAVALAAGSPAGFARVLGTLLAGTAAALVIRRVLRARGANWLCGRTPTGTAALLAAVAVTVGVAMHSWGLTAVLGAALVGLAIPVGDSAPWREAVAKVSRAGRALIPVFFVVAGITIFADGSTSPAWSLFAATMVLAVAGKLGGAYLGARRGGESRGVAVRIGVLMNTRGLTELIALQVGYAAGIITQRLFLVLVMMALATTMMTGPLLSAVEWAAARRQNAAAGGGVRPRGNPG